MKNLLENIFCILLFYLFYVGFDKEYKFEFLHVFLFFLISLSLVYILRFILKRALVYCKNKSFGK